VIHFSGKGILLDIEGTTSSVHFVYDEMFPFAKREIPGYVESHWGEEELVHALNLLAVDAGHESLAVWCGKESEYQQKKTAIAEAMNQMESDAKATGLKQLQGLVWESGFKSGELQAHIYEDVLPAIQAWSDLDKDIRIYSSGSIGAQKLFFSHTIQGNILPLIRGHYDTTTGPKKEVTSYETIVEQFGLAAEQILFISDIVDELDAAAKAGLQTALSSRPRNAEQPAGHSRPCDPTI